VKNRPDFKPSCLFLFLSEFNDSKTTAKIIDLPTNSYEDTARKKIKLDFSNSLQIDEDHWR